MNLSKPRQRLAIQNPDMSGFQILTVFFFHFPVPDFSLHTVKLFLQLFYTGKGHLSATKELRLVKEFSHNLLGFRMELEFYIAPPKDLVMDVGLNLSELTEGKLACNSRVRL